MRETGVQGGGSRGEARPSVDPEHLPRAQGIDLAMDLAPDGVATALYRDHPWPPATTVTDKWLFYAWGEVETDDCITVAHDLDGFVVTIRVSNGWARYRSHHHDDPYLHYYLLFEAGEWRERGVS